MIPVALVLLALLVVARYVLAPWLKLELRRRRSRHIVPAAGQVWAQDDGVLWVESTDATGVWLVTLHAGTLRRWQDTHEAWRERLNRRALWFTGQRRELVE